MNDDLMPLELVICEVAPFFDRDAPDVTPPPVVRLAQVLINLN